MAGSQLTAQPLRTAGIFNWIYMINWIVNGILCLFFLFYFNRLLATILTYAVRLYTWRKFKVYIDIEALQISPLAGRIFFKNLRYHGDNETILIHGGYITWRYWLRRAKECGVFNSNDDHREGSRGSGLSSDASVDTPDEFVDEKGRQVTSSLPCRITVKVFGVEAFLYNRGPAYDMILQNIAERDDSHEEARNQSHQTHLSEKFGPDDLDHRRQSAHSSSGNADEVRKRPQRFSSDETREKLKRVSTAETTQSSGEGDDDSRRRKALQPPAFLRIFPIRVECNKGAAVLGNENTKCIITAKFDKSSGEFNAARSGPLDIFKILIGFEVIRTNIQMKPNLDYKMPQLAEGASLKNEAVAGPHTEDEVEVNEMYREPEKPKLYQRLRWSALPMFNMMKNRSSESVNIKPKYSGKTEGLPFINADIPGEGRWIGLSRYLDDNQRDEHDEWNSVEYAKSSVLADVPKIGFRFYWDVAGTVPYSLVNGESKTAASTIDINGSTPPDYGMDLVVHGGQLNYGPWADRHRVVLQQLFFPQPFSNATPAKNLMPGETRLYTVFKLTVNVREDTILRIPFRESSKDANWKGRASTVMGYGKQKYENGKHKGKTRKSTKSKRNASVPGTDVRPFGWFDLKVGNGTSVVYNMDMVAGKTGYSNSLKLDVPGLNIFSSLNHGLVWQSQRVSMNCDLSNPLAWNALRTWVFNINIERLDFFLLRDHTFLLVDLIQDWGSGPQADFFTFTPYRYMLNVHFQAFKLFLNTNDANIIDNSEDLDDNEFVILYGRTLDCELIVPLDRFRPTHNTISFQVYSTDLGFELCMPSKNTLNELLTDKDVTQLSSVEVIGSYNYCSEVRTGLTETLNLDIIGKSLNISFFGFLARHLVKVKDNYFGESVHFRTLDEYQDLVRRNFTDADRDHPRTKSNDLDVILNITAEDTNALLPAGLYNAEEHVRIRVDSADVDLRVNNYYLELMVNSSPVELGYTARSQVEKPAPLETSATQLFLDGVKVFGHRLFGLPPSEPAYASNWDIDAGSITGEINGAFLEKAVAAAQSFALTMKDSENSLPIPHMASVHDSTFVRFCCPMIRTWCRADQVAFLISIGEISGAFNDLADRLFSQRLVMAVPDITVACVNAENVHRHLGNHNRIAETYAHVNTSLSFTMVQRSVGFEEQKRLQRQFIHTHDTRNRASFLLQGNDVDGDLEKTEIREASAASVPLPSLPNPVHLDHAVEQPSFSTGTNEDPWTPSTAASLLGVGRRLSRSAVPGKPVEAHLHNPGSRQQSFDRGYSAPRVAFSSPFKRPYFPMDFFSFDVSDVPQINPKTQKPSHSSGDPTFDRQIFDGTFDEDTVHTTIFVNVPVGFTAYCRPEAVKSAASLLYNMQPTYPRQLLDAFYFKSMTAVLGAFARRRGENAILDMNIKVPKIHLRFVNSFENANDSDSPAMSDRYDVLVDDIAVAARLKKVPSRMNEADANSMHATMNSLKIYAQEGSGSRKSEAVAFETKVDDTLIWLVQSDKTTVHTSFRTANVVVSSKEIEYLAKLIHRTTMLVYDFQTRFVQIIERQEKRLQYLAFMLATLGEEMPNPSFLRKQYFIRSNQDHVRNSNSWKILSRFYYSYLQLTHEQRAKLDADCIGGPLETPSNATATVLAQLDTWRAWDALDVKESNAVKILYGSLGSTQKFREETPLGLSIRAAGLTLLVDHGENQNELSLEQLAVGMSISVPPPKSDVHLFQPFDYDERKSTVLQIKTSRVSLRLSWSICELVDDLLTLFESTGPARQVNIHEKESSSRGSPMDPPTVESEDMHIVFSSDSAVAHLETINLVQDIVSTGLKVSVVGSGWNPLLLEKSVNAVLSADATSMEIHGHRKLLLRCNFISPSFWTAFDREKEADVISDELKIAGDCHELTFQIKEDLLGLIEILSSTIDDEATEIHRITQAHSQSATRPSGQTAQVAQFRPMKLDLNLFLKAYTIDVAILDDLSYTTVGHTIRLSISPESSSGSTYRVDYDLRSQNHRILGHSAEAVKTVSSMDMPPINGTARLLLTNSAVTASAMLTVETIVLEGGAVYSLLNTIGSRRFSNAFDAIRSDVISVKNKISEVFPRSTPPKRRASASSRTFIFDACVSMAGFAISADAPAAFSDSSPSNILFDVQAVHFRASNRSPTARIPLPFPEIKLTLQEMGMELRQVRDSGVQLCGKMVFSASFTCTVDQSSSAKVHREFRLSLVGPEVDLYTETAPILVEVLSHLQGRMKDLDLSRERKYLRRLRSLDTRKTGGKVNQKRLEKLPEESEDSLLDDSSLAFDLQTMRISYITESPTFKPVSHGREDLVLTLKSISLLTRSQAEARLNIEQLQLALVPRLQPPEVRSHNSALLPEVLFTVTHETTKADRKLTFHAAGQALDLQIDPHFIIPANDLERSLTISSRRLRVASKNLDMGPSSGSFDKQKLIGNRKLASLVIDMDFAGAIVRLQGSSIRDSRRPTFAPLRPQHGRYGQFGTDDENTSATLRAPGIALKVKYDDSSQMDPSLNVEFRVDGSNNVLYPAVVPLIQQITDGVKRVVREPEMEMDTESEDSPESPKDKDKSDDDRGDEGSIVKTDPRAILGRTKLNVGVRICKQEFSMSCQPIAKVAATAKLEDIYITVNNTESEETGHFFAGSARLMGLRASLQHVYSREPTFSFDIDSIVLSLMNSKHLSGTSGISAILRINPTRTQINAKQLQDILLFREIWLPAEIRNVSGTSPAQSTNESHEYFMVRYQQVAAATAFPWNATAAIEELSLDLDLGQTIGKMSFNISNFWATSRKTSGSQQNLCVGIDNVGISSTGRMSGFIRLEKVKLRTSIAWPQQEQTAQTPLIQCSVGFDQLSAKAAFEYQAFAVADITSFAFIMYNVRSPQQRNLDRLVAILDGDKVNVYCISSSAALALSLFQAFQRLVQEKKASYEQSLMDIEKFLRRRQSLAPSRVPSQQLLAIEDQSEDEPRKTPITLHTGVVVTLRSLDVGALPSTLLDQQVLKGEATDVQARFAVVLEGDKIHSGLGLTLGQLRIALATPPHPSMPRTLGEIMVEDVVKNATTARGGVILRVPRVVAAMQTWQAHDSNNIDYIFRSTFEGKIDVGWNYSRISFIRGMYATHMRTLSARLGKPPPEPAVKIRGAPEAPPDSQVSGGSISPEPPPAPTEPQKITAEVNLPLSKYTYRALEPPIIETPQLRDMGEATPPLEWVGLHRDRLPNVTHQIVIVTLLEIAKEVEDAYSRILGSA